MNTLPAKNRSVRQPLHLVLVLLGAVGLSVLSLKFFPRPFLWVGLAWIGALGKWMFCVQKPWPRAILFNVAFAVAAFTAAEAYFSIFAPGRAAFIAAAGSAVTYPDGWIVPSDVLGWAPKKAIQAHGKKLEHGRPLYDVAYTIDSNGLRLAPPVRDREPSGCVLFFGCSFAFGDGLHDNETLPYQVGIRSAGKYRPFNFGFSGYGPHQMLSQIENGLINPIVDCKPKYAIYTAITDHVARVAGKVPFGHNAPHYQLSAGGSVERTGDFEKKHTKHSFPVWKLLSQLSKSTVYNIVAQRGASVSQDDVHLLLAIVGRSRALLETQYPGLAFHVILWESYKEEQETYRRLEEGLRQMGIATHLVNDILPGYALGRSKYVFSSTDRHPTAAANRILADYVLARIVTPDSASK